MRRARLVVLITLLAWCGVADAEDQSGKRRVAVLHHGTASSVDLRAFVDELQGLGWTDGRNVALDLRYAEGRTERYPELAADAMRFKPDVVVAVSTPGAVAAKTVTTTTPIVMVAVSDPVGSKLVPSLARPGGNITGLSLLAPELSAKRVDIMKQALPKLARLGVLWNVQNEGMQLRFREVSTVAPTLGIHVMSFGVSNPAEFDDAFAAVIRERPHALLVLADTVTVGQRKRTAEFAEAHRIPAIYEMREFVDVGGLMSYGINMPAHFRRAATYVDRILRGARPADLPVEQPSQFELLINMRAARALGLALPQSLLLRADQVLE